MSDSEKKIQRASLLMMASVLLSRVIGFVREWVLAQTVGASAMTDVYSASFTIPDFINSLMAAGALSISFVPLLTSYLTKKDQAFADRVFRSIAGTLGGFLLAFVILCEVFALPLSRLVAPGFSPAQLEMLATLLRIILPAQLFFYWGGLAIALQYAHGHFLFPALAPLIYNSGIIIFGVALHRSLGVMGFSIGVLAGCIFSHGVLQAWGIRRLGYRLMPSWDLSPEIRHEIARYLWLTLPIMMGFSLVVADEWFSKYFASSMGTRAVSWLHYARIEMRIPVAVIGQAAGIASFPFLARLWAEGSTEQYTRTLLREVQKLWAAAPLAAIFFYTHALPITHFIFGGSKLNTLDMENTAQALRMFSVGIFFWTLQLILSRGFYACQRTWLPSIIGTLISFVCLPLYWYLGDKMGFSGLALAGSVGIALYCLVLWVLLRGHLRRHVPNYDLQTFYGFCALWTLFLGFMALAAQQLGRLQIYQGTQTSAFLSLVAVLTVLIGVSLLALRTVFARLTDGQPLY
ncbi:MAG: murein biosynthesis integral membrane protein MurJ [Bdellovibrionales bacterium]|nr:murein biosynthesis integral membrane protein MurJ [Bdellovibrionales bacterium]